MDFFTMDNKHVLDGAEISGILSKFYKLHGPRLPIYAVRAYEIMNMAVLYYLYT